MTEPRTPAQRRFLEAVDDVVSAAAELKASGQKHRLAGLAVGVDLGVSAAFLFDLSDRAYDDATRLIRESIAHATRPEDE